MKAFVWGLLSFYSVSLLGFLVFIRKSFLQFSGETAIPSLQISEDSLD